MSPAAQASDLAIPVSACPTVGLIGMRFWSVRWQPAAISWTLLTLGTGLNLSAAIVSAQKGISLLSLGLSGDVWFLFTHVLNACIRGLFAGLLRGASLDGWSDQFMFRDPGRRLTH